LTIRLNGEPHELAGPLTITALLTGLGIDPRRVAVEHNQIVVKRGAYDSTHVREQDEVEIVNFVGGGCGAVPSPAGYPNEGQALAASKGRPKRNHL
jgi:thiamine biosynthesis protein ThiS